jgi:hypothetical protein
MNEEFAIDYEALFPKIERYLAVVDLYRAEDCEPTWRPELLLATNEGTRARPERAGARPARA